jgi:thiol-disulfide isomerase/thioredoxin
MNKLLLTLSASISASLAIAQASNYPNGSTVADFTVTDTHGQVHNLNAYAAAGKYVLLDFFFYNCGPCQAHAPYYSELYQTYGCNGGDLICIEINDGQDTDALTEAFSEDFAPGFSHPPAVGTGGGPELTTTFGVGAFPTFCLISPAKVMINQDIWPVSSMSTFVSAFPSGSDITPQACVVGIEEPVTTQFTSVYPTVTDRSITIAFSGPRSQTVDIRVFDLLGHNVLNQTASVSTGTTRTLDLGALPNGDYLLKLVANGVTSDTRRVAVIR